MPRGSKPAKSKEAKPPVARKSSKDDGAMVRELEKRLAEALRREKEGQEQQAATAEILRVISQSPTDLRPVFATIVRNAVQLCGATYGSAYRIDGDVIDLVAETNLSGAGLERFRLSFPRPLRDGGVIRDVVESRRFQYLENVDAYPFSEAARALFATNSTRSLLTVPMIRKDQVIGAFSLGHPEPSGFPDGRIDLVRTFADQAVIAIENVRLFNETKEALERQTATAEILRVISSSPTDIQQVFETIAEAALRFFGAWGVLVFRYDEGLARLAAVRGGQPGSAEALLERSMPSPPVKGTFLGETILRRTAQQIVDVETDTVFGPALLANARERGWRSGCQVPMLRGSDVLGVIAVSRTEPGPFSSDDIALLQTFADQAVIAIENARLFNETKEALEQQTATAEILGVISGSPTNVQPTFEAIAESATRLCGAVNGLVFHFDGELIHVAAHHNIGGAELDAILSVFPIRPGQGSIAGRAIEGRRIVHVEDLAQDPEYEQTRVVQAGFRTALSVPMMRGELPIGTINVMRMAVAPFSPSQIALLQSFADQAVIAIENVRLFNETKEALERQTATSEILRVISSSPTDVQPVFDAIVTSATRLLRGYSGSLYRLAGDQIELIALTSTDAIGDAALKAAYPRSVDSDDLNAQAIRRRVPLNFAEAQTDPRLPEITHAYARARGFQSVGVVPMLRHDEAIGAIGVGRRDPGGFTDDEIALLETFADQAVIAIENMRLFTELQEKNQALTQAHAQVTEALEQQTATSDILRVISSSPTDVQPVFDTIASSAARLCDTYDVFIRVLESEGLRTVAHHGPIPASALIPVVRGSVSGRVVLERRTVHVDDIQGAADEFPEGATLGREFGHRTNLGVPLLREGVPLGAIVMRRAEARPFTDKEIALLKTFADQAVIAIENVRLFNETKEALEQQTATAEILRVISSSPTDVQPVYDSIVERAARLCDAEVSLVARLEGEWIHVGAVFGTSVAGTDAVRRTYPMRPGAAGATARAIRDSAIAHIPDVLTDQEFTIRDAALTAGFRAVLAVPMLREGRAIGAISIGRAEAGEFSTEQVNLLRTFADQAVIAIENVRLFNELETRTQDLTRSVGELQALGEVGQAISSTLDLQAVLSTIAARATQLSGTDAGVIYEYDEPREVFVPRATEHLEAEIIETMLAMPVRKGEGATGRLAEAQEPIQVPDILAAPAESRVRDALVRAGYRALLAVPLVRDGHLLGGLTVIRKATGAFVPEVIDLLRTFATQSTLAIQNARLFREIEEKSRQLEAASQHKSEFLANMSHELRTPLNAIIGFSEVLSEKMFGELNEKQEEYSKDIHASGQHLLSLINDILDLSKIEAGRMELELTDFHLPTALDSALTLVRERAGRRGIALHLSVDERLGQMRADERKVRQIVLNLLSNSIKFTPEGGRIEVGAVPKDGLVEVSVRDTGVGIDPEDQEAVFEEFRQVGTADKKVEGTGLGLTLCRKFVELHGGRIWVKSELGVGSTFTFTLPLRRA